MELELNQEFMNSILREPRAESARVNVLVMLAIWALGGWCLFLNRTGADIWRPAYKKTTLAGENTF